MAELELVLTATTRALWEARHEVWCKSTTKAYQRTTRHLLPLHDIKDVATRVSVFYDLAELLNWQAPSKERNFRAFLAATKVLGRPIEPLETATMKLLNVEAKSRLPERYTVPLSQEEYEATRHLLLDLAWFDAVLLLDLAYLLGQRVGDVIRIKAADVHEIFDPSSQTKFLAITFFEGKTIRRTRPYSVHLPLSSWAATRLLTLKTVDCFQSKMLTYRRLRSQLPPQASLLSIRKGGLQRMVMGGATTATVLHHSRHTGAEMLDRYLDYGRANLWGARDLMEKNLF
jgi:integrase